MLTDFQRNQAWQSMLDAETRSLYFADLTNRYTNRKQWITGLSFFLASGAAATIVGKLPPWFAVSASMVVALLNAYAMAINLDRKVSVMADLHGEWNRIADDYRRLWSHVDDADAEQVLNTIAEKELRPSELGVTEAPNDVVRLRKWQDRVFVLHNLVDAQTGG